MWSLKLRMWLLTAVLFAIVYAMAVVAGTALHITSFSFYIGLALVMMFIQYMVGPKIVEWTMRVKYIQRQENPKLYNIVEGLAVKAEVPMPRIGIAQIPIPNAFAFGRSIKDGRICVTSGIMELLDEQELKAVLGHEMTHLKSRDVLTITLLSVIPMIMYRIALQFLFYGRRRDERSGASTVLIGLAAFIFYFITSLLVLYASRIREYFADRGSIQLGNSPHALASSLYKLVYGSARMNKDVLKEVEGLKAFFVNDPSRAASEIRDLMALDLDKNGTLSAEELQALSNKKVRLSFADRFLEAWSTHPNMLKRIKQLSTYPRA